MSIDRTQIFKGLASILEQMLDDWGVELDEPINDNSQLVADLEFSSIDIIHLAVALEQHFERPKLGFNELLMDDGQYIDDLSVGKIVDFLVQKLAE